jgi:glucosylceramidase
MFIFHKCHKSKAMKPWNGSLVLATIIMACFISTIQAQPVSVWVTAGDKSKLMQKQTDLNFGTSGTNATKITLDENTHYQTIDGFGHAFTEGSAEVIYGLATTQQDSLLNDLFNLSTGMGMSVIRVALGACDLGNGVYSYDDLTTGNDTNMTKFSLKGVDSTYLVPILKKVVAINPNIKILACPWSPPPWMKTNNAFIGGSVATQYYAAYAKYFVKYIQAMKANGINIWAITPQNEPGVSTNNPSCTWTSQQETNFINNNLGPAFKAAGITTKIIAYDHNCDDTNFPIYVCTNASTYVDGAAFHLYAGNISVLTTVYNATHKNVYQTELCTCNNDFSGNFSNHVRNVMIGTLTNWGKASIEWNLATNPSLGPHTDNGGCGVCYGGVMVNSATSYSLLASYYIVAQFSKVIKTDAVRIATTSTNSNLLNVACINADGMRAAVVYNATGSSSTFDLVWNGQTVPFTLANNAAASFLWQGPVSVEQRNSRVLATNAFVRNFPEPFTSSTRINVYLTKTTEASVMICSSKGTVVASLMHGMQAQGSHDIVWNGTDACGRHVSAGVYVVKLAASGFSIAKRILKQ